MTIMGITCTKLALTKKNEMTTTKLKSIEIVTQDGFKRVLVTLVVTDKMLDQLGGNETEIKLFLTEPEAWHLSEEISEKLTP